MSNATRNARRTALLTLGLIGLAAGNAYGVNYDWQANPGYSGTFNNATNWNAGAGVGASGAPGTSDDVSFQNAQASPYTVDFNANITTEFFEVKTDKVNFDLAGFQWTSVVPNAAAFDIGGSPGTAWRIGAGAGESATVVFSSSAPGGVINTPNSPDTTYRSLVMGNSTGTTRVTVNNSLGNGATWVAQGNLLVSGDTEFNIDAGGVFTSNYPIFYQLGGGAASINVRNGGQFLLTTATYSFAEGNGPGLFHFNVETGGLLDMPLTNPNIGYLNPAFLDVKTGGTWNAQDPQVGLYNFYTGKTSHATVTIDGATSTANVRNMTVGNATDLGANDDGEVILKNGGTMTVKNTMLLNVRFANAIPLEKNALTLDGGTLKLGDASNVGTLTSRGLVRGNGTITRGTGNTATMALTIAADGELRPGDTTATPAYGDIAVSNGNLTVAVGGLAAMDFGLNGLALDNDTVTLTGGVVTLSGDIAYNVLGGYTPHVVSSVEYFDFITAPSIVYAPASDNMASLMAGFGLGPSDYFYGIRSIGGNDVLRLEVPEPASMSLLAIGGALLIRRKRVR